MSKFKANFLGGNKFNKKRKERKQINLYEVPVYIKSIDSTVY